VQLRWDDSASDRHAAAIADLIAARLR
jgi:hypothetical protein